MQDDQLQHKDDHQNKKNQMNKIKMEQMAKTFYVDALRMAVMNTPIAKSQIDLLANIRNQYSLTLDDHLQALTSLDLTKQLFEEMKEKTS